MKLRPAIYPGTFDPITYGHIDVVNRAAAMFPRLIILVARNPVKAPMFSDIERIAMIREVFRGRKNITVDGFDGLLVDYARQTRATAIIRGLRAVSDFEYEFQMALMNRKLYRRHRHGLSGAGRAVHVSELQHRARGRAAGRRHRRLRPARRAEAPAGAQALISLTIIE